MCELHYIVSYLSEANEFCVTDYSIKHALYIVNDLYSEALTCGQPASQPWTAASQT